jgi:hypothetical protein
LMAKLQPGNPHGRCAIKPHSAGDFYVGVNRGQTTVSLPNPGSRSKFNLCKDVRRRGNKYGTLQRSVLLIACSCVMQSILNQDL